MKPRHLLDLVPICLRADLRWSLLELEGRGDLTSRGTTVRALRDRIDQDAYGMLTSHADLVKILSDLEDLYEITICGYEKYSQRPRFRSDLEPETVSQYFLQLIDSSIWRICSTDPLFLKNAKNLFALTPRT